MLVKHIVYIPEGKNTQNTWLLSIFLFFYFLLRRRLISLEKHNGIAGGEAQARTELKEVGK